MFIPDVINTLLMGLIFMVVIVTVVRPFVLSIVGDAMSNNDMHKAAMVEVEREMLRKAELFEAQRADKIRYQMLLLEVPEKPRQKPELEPEAELPVEPEVVVEEAPAEVLDTSVEDAAAEAALHAATEATALEEDAPAGGEIEIREGESLADIKDRIRKEQQKAKKPTIPPELLNSANSYEDKVGVVRMVVQADQARVAAAIRGMIQIK